MYKYFLILVISILLSGCYNLKAATVMLKSSDHFLTLDENPVIRYEEGAEEYALQISSYINVSINIIESKQHGKFPEKITVYVPKSIESFSSFCASEIPRACVIGDRLFMSPKLQQETELIKAILIHELSHLQLSQHVGRWSFQANIPSWFKEGLAVYVSEGGGAEKVTKEEAAESIKKGETFKPNGTGSFLFPKTASSFNLTHQMYYRQTSLFVEWLHNFSSDNFKILLLSLRDNRSIDEAMQNSYGFGVDEGWKRFVLEIKT